MNFGVDLGMGANKIWGPGGGVQLPSHAAIDTGQVVSHLAGLRAQKRPLQISVNGRSFHVGVGAHEWGRPVESMDYSRLGGSPEMVAVFYGAFTRYMEEHGRIREPVKLIAGMPLQPLTGDETAVRGMVSSVKGWLRGHHAWQADGIAYTLDVAEVGILPQPAGALSDFLLDDDGRDIPGRKQHIRAETGVISIGFNTIELLVMQNRAPVQRFTGGDTRGVRRLLELADGNGMYSLGELDTRLRAGDIDLREPLTVWAGEVTGHIERVWGRAWRRFSAIVVVGGGAILLQPPLIAYFNGKAHYPDDPVLSIARGLFKMGQARGR